MLGNTAPYGITNDEIDEATNYYRYPPGSTEIWPYTHAVLTATVEDGSVVSFEIVSGGNGYTSEPVITVDGYGAISVDVTISYTGTFSTNGAITAITLEEISDSAVTSDVGSGRLELTSLPLGDDKHSSSPQQGYIYSCTTNFGRGGGAFNTGPWIDEDAGTYDMTGKVFVDGSNTWSNAYITISDDGSTRYIQANGLPTNHGTGDYPVESTDDAYNYDRNPNSVTEQNASYSFPLNPTIANQATCVSSGAIAVSLNGVVIFNGFDLLARDAVAYEIQDVCDGHPERTGEYHYHSSSACFEDVLDSDGHSSLFAYAFDGFGLYGKQSGGEYVTNSDLDECHGHSHTIDEDNDMHHYHLTDEFPYTIGCYRGTP